MCLRACSAVQGSFNWEGDEIVADPVVLAGRHIPGTKKRYPIDIREYLISEHNAVVRNALREIETSLTGSARDLFGARVAGAFDHRVRSICDYLARTIPYRRRQRGFDSWLFPDETLAAPGGDCEDHALLLAALLLASGISGYVVRVALGRLVPSRGKPHDHAWVMYRSEAGPWLLLDPLIYTKEGRAAKPGRRARTEPSVTYSYVPHFVFNDTHLWAVRHADNRATLSDFVKRQAFFKGFDPTFAADVHSHIFDAALAGMSWIDRQFVKTVSLAVDANLASYDPRDHFDNGYIADSFARVSRRLNGTSLSDFALACHAIGDFYAHSSWGLFGERKGGVLQALLEPNQPRYALAPSYDAASVLPIDSDARFTVNDSGWHGPRGPVAAAFRGQLLSGRYAQIGDPHQSLAERATYIPQELRSRRDYAVRTGLPHHEELAVDGPTRGDAHRVYPDQASYARAFAERRAAATMHVRAAYQAWPGR